MYIHLISRKIARDRGLKFFFTGKPCILEGVGIRRVSDHCCQCEYHRLQTNQRKKVHYNINSERLRQTRADRRAADPERAKLLAANYRGKNREKIRKWHRDSWMKNINRKSILRKVYYTNNRHLFIANNIERKTRKIERMPLWFGELDRFVFSEAVSLCKLRERVTGEKWHVDHAIPLFGEGACGLHCALNFQVIPARMNLTKRNRMILTEPFEWVALNPGT